MQIEAALEGLQTARVDVPNLAQDIDATTQRVRMLSGVRAAANPHNAWAFPARDTKNLLFLTGELDSQMLAVDGADATPSPDVQKGYEALLPLVETTLKAWDQVKSGELAALNAKLKAAGKAEIKVE